MPPKADSLFRWIEDRECEILKNTSSSWGRVLDAGTGRHSLSWLLKGDASSFIEEVVAVTGEEPLANELSIDFSPSNTPHATPLKVMTGNWQNEKFLALEKPFDVIIADYLIGAIEGFAPYYQDQICGRLEQMLAPNGRMYLVGLQPLIDPQTSLGSSDADADASKMIQHVARTRNACLLLAGRRCYREYPMEWAQRQLVQSGLSVTNTVRYANVYGLSAIIRQLEVGRRHVPMFQDADLAACMQKALDRIEKLLKDEFGSSSDAKQRKISFGFDYVIAAHKKGKL